MKSLLRASLAAVFCVCVAGCAAPRGSSGTSISADNARNAIVIGRSTKAEVIAALGKTTVVSFDSGFEVWIYLIAQPPGRNEFVVLFSPTGVVAKTRIRFAPPLSTNGAVRPLALPPPT